MNAIITLAFIHLFVGGFALMLGLAASIFWVWMLVDCAQNEPRENSSRVLWILVILFTHFLGALLYFLIRKSARA